MFKLVKLCLNCAEEIDKKYCANCGQKADTHRITFRKFLTHDLMHGTFHLERGILFTIKEALFRPGRAALDYISGMRVRYYNVFYLCLILIGIDLLISGVVSDGKESTDPTSRKFLEFFHSNVKILVLTIIPLLALNAALIFRRLKLNFAEHLIVAGFGFAGMLSLSVGFGIFTILENSGFQNWFTELMLSVFVISIFFFPAWLYANLTHKHYMFLGILWRIIVFYLLWILEMFLLVAMMIKVLTGKSEIVIT